MTLPAGGADVRREVHYTGRVQGVGFRQTVQAIAARHAITGYVQNLEDGRVRLAAEGAKEELARFLDEIAIALGRFIVVTNISDEAGRGKFSGFQIRQ